VRDIDRGAPSETLTASAATVDPAGATAEGSGQDLAPRVRIDRYELIEVLGEGSMGRVFRARDTELAREVALKQIQPGRQNVAQAQARLRREAQAMARVEHPAVVRIYDVPVVNGELFVAMELARGGTLVTWLKVRPRGWREVIRMFSEAGRGLAAAHHAGLVHRDVKPSNIVLDGHGRAKISDFGLARMFGGDEDRDDAGAPALGHLDATITRTGAIAGTLAYMAPEQFTGEPVDARADQFAFCVALWEALCGRRPFQVAHDAARVAESYSQAIAAGPSEVPRRVRVPRRILAVVERGLARDRGARWPSLDELLDALAGAARPRRRWWLAGALVIGIAGAAVAWAARSSAPAPPVACGERDQLGAAWSASIRAGYLAVAATPEAREDAGWFDWYAGALAREYATSCGRAEPAKIACLDGALADLRAAIARPERKYWPRLRALDRCGTTWRETDAGVVNNGEMTRLSYDGRQLSMRPAGRAAILRELGSNRSWPLDLVYPLRWLPDGSIAGLDAQERIAIVDPRTEQVTRAFEGHHGVIDVSPDLRTVARVSDQALSIVPMSGGEPLVEPIAGNAWFTGSFSPDNRRFAVAEPVDGGMIHVDDLVTRHREAIAFRVHLHNIGVTQVRWLDPTSFVISGSATSQVEGDLWSLRVDAAGRLVGPPQILLRGERDIGLTPHDAQAGRLLVERLSITPQAIVVDEATSTSLPGLASRLYPVDVDRAHRRVLVATDPAHTRWAWMSLDGSNVEPIASLDGLRSAAAGGAGLAALDLRTDPPVYVALDEAGHELARMPLVEARGASPTLRCGTHRCLVKWNVGKVAFTIQIDGQTIGRAIRRDQPEFARPSPWEIASDGTRIAFSPGVLAHDLAIYDLERAVASHTTAEALSRIQHAWFSPDGGLVMSGVSRRSGADVPTFAVVRRDATGRDHVVWRGEPWVAGVAQLDDHRLLLSTSSFHARLSLLEPQ
jgi:hypothetical protein